MRLHPPAPFLAIALLVGVAACTSPSVAPAPQPEARAAAEPAPASPALVQSAPPPGPAETPALKPDDPTAILSPGGIVLPVLGRDGESWKVSTPCGREAVVPGGTALPRNKPVVIDPGHGGYDPGAVGPNNLYESELNLSVSRHAVAALEAAGVPTVLTRNGDHGMNLTNRARLAVGLQARAFVSVHHNAASWDPSPIPGSEMYHQVSSAESKRLAGLIYEEIVAALRVYDVAWVTSGAGVTWRTKANGEDWYAMVNQPRGIHAALAELAFISNPPEADLLADPDVQRVEGQAVARGILRFLNTSEPGSGYIEGGRMPPRPRSGGGPRTGGAVYEDPCDDPAL